MEQYVNNLNWFDITLITIVVVSTLFATLRGFIKAIFSLVTWIVSAGIAVLAYPKALEFSSTKIHNEQFAMAAALVGSFLVTFFILAFVNSHIVYALRRTCGGFLDRTLGFIFGAARGALIVCLIFFSINLTSKMLHLGNPERPGPAWFAEASLYDELEAVTKTALTMAPEDLPTKLEATVSKVKDITLAKMENELKASAGAATTLSEGQQLMMSKVLAGLPEEQRTEIYKKYDGNISLLSEFERVAMYREILDAYKEYEKQGKIIAEGAVDPSVIAELGQALDAGSSTPSAATPDNSIGYKERNIKQMDRLIEGVQVQ